MHIRALFVTGILMLDLVACSRTADRSNVHTPDSTASTVAPTHSEVPNVNRPVALTPEERSVISRAEHALGLLATKSARAKVLRDFYWAHKVYASYVDSTHVMVVEPANAPFFMVTVAPGSNMMEVPRGGSIAAAFEGASRTMMLYITAFNDTVLGLYFVHELHHAEDYLTGKEGDSAPFSLDWLYGEYLAQFTGHTVLDEYTGGAWKKLVDASIARRRSLALSQGKSVVSFSFGASEEDSAAITTLFGPLSRNDLSGLSTQLMVDANLINFSREGGVQHKSDDEVMELTFRYLGQFYRKMMPQPHP